MNGQLDRFKELIKNDITFVKTEIICFISGSKAGGKSFSLYNYAYHNSINNQKVLVLEPNRKNYSYLRFYSNQSFSTVSNNAENILGMEKVNDNFYVRFLNISGDTTAGSFPALMKELKDTHDFDKIFINTVYGQTEFIVSDGLRPDEIIIVSLSDPISIIDSYAAIKVLLKNNFDKKISVILNKIKSFDEFTEAEQNLRKAVEHFLHYTVVVKFGIPIIENFSGNLDKAVLSNYCQYYYQNKTE